MADDIRRIMIESTVRRALSRAGTNPNRTLRSLVDLAVESSSGVVQLPFFTRIQTLLESADHSPYYELVKRVIADVDVEHLITFGINLGYEGCTKGAEALRANERRLGFNIPWAVTVEMPHDTARAASLVRLIQEAYELGIRVFPIYAADRPQDALNIASRFSDCAFIVFCRPQAIDSHFVRNVRATQNVLISVHFDHTDAARCACEALRCAHVLFGAHLFYPASEYGNDGIIRSFGSALAAGPHFIFFIARPGCPRELAYAVRDWVETMRMEQRYPVIVSDVFFDRIAIDRAISDDPCSLSIDAEGRPVMFDSVCTNPVCNAYEHGLSSVLADLFPKASASIGRGTP